MDAVLMAIVDKAFIFLVMMFALVVAMGTHSVILESVDAKKDTIHIMVHVGIVWKIKNTCRSYKNPQKPILFSLVTTRMTAINLTSICCALQNSRHVGVGMT